jgi:hypothetical protein
MKRRKTITAQVTEESGRRNFWTRSELRAELGKISNKTNKPMAEATFKRRLALLEEECPEIDHRSILVNSQISQNGVCFS